MTPDKESSPPADTTVVPLGAHRGDRTAPEREGEQAPRPTRPFANLSPRRMLRLSRLFAGLLTACWLIAWPVGSSLSQAQATGTNAIRFGYSIEMLVMALSSIALVWFLGWAIAAGLRMEVTARRLTNALAEAGRMPDSATPDFARRQIGTLNEDLDAMLTRLADAESMIRQQVRALNAAGNAIDEGTAKSAARLQQERSALMDLTEEMNREVESFAEKIAERTSQAATDAEQSQGRTEEKQRELDVQLQRLESVSAKSLDRFEQLASTMENRGDELSTINAEATERQTAIAGQIEENSRRIETAQAELASQSERLEMLMREQRHRADRLAKVVTNQMGRAASVTEPTVEAEPKAAPAKPAKKAKPAQATHEKRKAVPWKDILPKASLSSSLAGAPSVLPRTENDPKVRTGINEARPRPDTSAVPSRMTAASVASPDQPSTDHLIERLHHFSLVVQTQLFGVPSHDELSRFETGERQIFARALVRGSNDELRHLIADEIARNRVFQERVAEFLRDFDSVLEPLAVGEQGEQLVESYLTSPIGQLYIATGSAAGHFS